MRMLKHIRTMLEDFVRTVEYNRKAALLDSKLAANDESYRHMMKLWMEDRSDDEAVAQQLQVERARGIKEGYDNGYADGKADAIISIGTQLAQQGVAVKAMKLDG